MSDHAANSEEQCASTFKPPGRDTSVRCIREVGHAGWHQDERYNWPVNHDTAKEDA